MKKNIILVFLFIMFMPFIVNAETCDTNKITIENILLESKTDNVVVLDEATASGKNINLNLSMSEVGDNIEYKFIVKNESNEDYELYKTSLNINSDYINYSFETDDNSNIVKANSSKNVTLRVAYKKEVPEDKLENGKYNDNKTIRVSLSTGELKNPNTETELYIIFVILLLVSGILYRVLKKKKIAKYMALIVSIFAIIPICVYAICKSDININININVKIEKTTLCGSFSNDSWDVISYNIKNHNDSCYHVGDTKKIELEGFGTHIVRIANKSKPDECYNDEFSKTACDFVVEFADIITLHNICNNSSNEGGWPACEMRSYVSNDIYNALPTELKNIIISTKVISGHSWRDSENFTSTDKLYLLSFYEVYGSNIGFDFEGTIYDSTRQLDYYARINNIFSNPEETYKKYNNSFSGWWLRSPYERNSGSYFGVYDCGYVEDGNCGYNCGVSPAFRIG